MSPWLPPPVLSEMNGPTGAETAIAKFAASPMDHRPFMRRPIFVDVPFHPSPIINAVSIACQSSYSRLWIDTESSSKEFAATMRGLKT